MPKTLRHSVLLLFAVLLTCPGQGLLAGTEGDLQPVRVQLKWTHQFQFAGHYAAIEQGYYRDAGLDVVLHEASPGLNPIDQLLGGRVEFAVADTGALIYRAASAPLVALAAIFQHSPSVLLTLEQSGIRELADIRHRRVMLGGGYLNAELMATLARAGIGGDDFQLVPIDPSLDALLEDRTDVYNAYTTNEPYFLDQQGVRYVIFQPRDYGVDFYGDILLTTEAVIARNPDLARRFREATLRGWDYAVKHPEAVVDLIYNHYNTTGKSRDHLRFEAQEAIKLILPEVVPVGYMNEDRWRRIADTFQAQGMLRGEVDFTEFLYQPEETALLVEFLTHYGPEILFTLVGLSLLAMLLHILRLRNQIGARTRELDRARQQAEVEARTDALTCLPNRRRFFEDLSRDIALAERHGTPLSIISLDIDHFKAVNDHHGHAAGDQALRHAAQVLRRFVRVGDVAARIGGEEFALACPNTDGKSARQLAERIRKTMVSTPVEYGECQIGLSLSIGVAGHIQGESADDLLRRADLALYRAKQQGRNQVCEWSPEATVEETQ